MVSCIKHIFIKSKFTSIYRRQMNEHFYVLYDDVSAMSYVCCYGHLSMRWRLKCAKSRDNTNRTSKFALFIVLCRNLSIREGLVGNVHHIDLLCMLIISISALCSYRSCGCEKCERNKWHHHHCRINSSVRHTRATINIKGNSEEKGNPTTKNGNRQRHQILICMLP